MPAPPTSHTSASPVPPHPLNARQQAGTPDSGKVLRQPPATPPKMLPVPILGNKSGSGGRVYRGPLDSFEEDENSSQYSRSHQRPSAISIFSTSAPPINSGYIASRRSVVPTKFGNEDSHEDDKVDSDEDGHEVVRTSLSSIDAGKPAIVTNGGRHYRVKSQSIGQTLNQQQHGRNTPANITNNHDTSSPAPKPNPTVTFGSPSVPHQQNLQQQHHHQPGRVQLNNGYNSSGSSSVALTSSYSSQSNNSSSVSSLGSVAALLEEEERMMNEVRRQENQSGIGANNVNGGSGNGHSKNGLLGVPSAFQLGTQTQQSRHVGIGTMLSRGTNNGHNDLMDAQEKEVPQSAKVSAAYNAAGRQAPSQYHHQHSQSLAGVRSVHPLEQQRYQSNPGSKLEFSPGYEPHSYGSTNVNAGWRASSPSGISYSNMSTTAPSSPLSDLINNANNRKGGKAIRRSMGVALEKERWD
ncbi:hypothetical protein BGZ80_003366 [Entomortierella chlamydospora]|uniref:Uncharacterized protein n=1 Tax=Entomortierella chlamydospora TaxID=101097 RepID=A0A9P6MN98_9FUNG|nr:hypothetical protein BGZ80_003366 [Entomortierella chlamydospora]